MKEISFIRQHHQTAANFFEKQHNQLILAENKQNEEKGLFGLKMNEMCVFH